MVPADIFLKHIIFPVVIVLIVLGNGALIHALATTKRRHGPQSLMNYFVISLAVSDFLVGCPTMPMLLVAEKQLPSAGYACMAVMCLTVQQTSASCLLLIAVGVERYVAILKPLHYQSLVTKRRAMIGICACWALAMFLGLLPFFGWNTLHERALASGGTHLSTYGPHSLNSSSSSSSSVEDLALVDDNSSSQEGSPQLCRFPLVFSGSYVGFVFCGLHFPLWLILATLYGRIMTQCRRQRSLICSLRGDVDGTGRHQCSACSSRKNYKIFRVLTLLVCYFILSWFPLALYYALIYRGFRKDVLEVSDLQDSGLTSWVYPVAVSLAYTNSAVNPFLYGFGNRTVRRAWGRTRVVQGLVSLWVRLRGGCTAEPEGTVVKGTRSSVSVSRHSSHGFIHQRCAPVDV